MLFSTNFDYATIKLPHFGGKNEKIHHYRRRQRGTGAQPERVFRKQRQLRSRRHGGKRRAGTRTRGKIQPRLPSSRHSHARTRRFRRTFRNQIPQAHGHNDVAAQHGRIRTESPRYGAKYFLAKPFNFDVLLKTLDEFSGEENYPAVTRQPQPAKRNRSLDEKIANLFISVGIPAHIKGYQFLREAIKITVDDPEIINSITKKLYPSIAATFNTTASKVERAIRHAIEVAWNRGKIENINQIFGMKIYSANEKPTNGEFIALVADKMLLEGA